MIPALPPAASVFAAPIHPCAQTYYNRLHPWLIVQQVPTMQRVSVCRFRQRQEAKEYLKVLRRLSPDADYQLIFDPPDLRSP